MSMNALEVAVTQLDGLKAQMVALKSRQAIDVDALQKKIDTLFAKVTALSKDAKP